MVVDGSAVVTILLQEPGFDMFVASLIAEDDPTISVATLVECSMVMGGLRYGKGRHPAGLNFADCFGYALAVTSDRPLLFQGDDFTHTDVTSVL